MSKKIAFQGELGAYSHQACIQSHPELTPLPCKTFEGVIESVHNGDAELAMLPVENSTAGRVPDLHILLPQSNLHIISEEYVRVRINMLGVDGAHLKDITDAMSHAVLLGQCRKFLKQNGINRITGADTAGSAKEVARRKDKTLAALASPIAGEIYGLNVLAEHIEDNSTNTTRFLVMSRQPDYSRRGDNMRTSFVFQVRNIPAALYKAMGGFATNGVNMTKLESYMVGGSFTATQFYADIDGHPEDENVKLAFEELDFFTDEMKILGVYPTNRHET